MNFMMKPAAIVGLTVVISSGCAMFEQPHKDKMYLETYEGKQVGSVRNSTNQGVVDGQGAGVKSYGYGSTKTTSTSSNMRLRPGQRQILSESKPMTMEELNALGDINVGNSAVTDVYSKAASPVVEGAARTAAAVIPAPAVATEIYNKTPVAAHGQQMAPQTAASEYAPAFESSPVEANTQPDFNPRQVTPVQANYAPTASQAAATTAGGHGYFVQAGAFSSRANADRFAARLKTVQGTAVEVLEDGSSGQMLYKTQIGPFASIQEAMTLDGTLRQIGVKKPAYLSR